MIRRFYNFWISRIDILRRKSLSLLNGATVGARALVINESGSVLLVRHTYRSGWHTPGGGVNSDESPVTAIRRELIEEVGLTILGEPKLLHIYVSTYRFVTDYPIFYLVENYEGTARNCDGSEIAEVIWVTPEEAISITGSKTSAFLRDYFNQASFQERW